MSPKRTDKVALASPGSLPFRWVFWRNHFSFLLWLVICLFLLVFLFKLFLPEPGAGGMSQVTLPLYCIIYIITLWGIFSIVRTMGKFDVEDAIARMTDIRASEELRKIRGNESDRISLERVFGFVPANPNENLSMPRLFNYIIEEARDRKFESGVVLMQPFREESMGEMINASILQKTALQMGILGTFMGLIGAFTNLDFQELENSLDIMSKSLQFSFSTSIAGLVAAILLGLLLTVLRKKQETYFKTMERASGNLIALVRNADNKDYLMAEFQQINNSVSNLEKRVYRQTQELSHQTEQIKSGIGKLASAQSGFDHFLQGISEAEKKFLEEMKGYHQILSPEEISKSLKSSLDTAVVGVSNSLNQNLAKSIEGYQKLEVATKGLSSNIADIKNLSREQIEKQQELIESSGVVVRNSSEVFQKSINDITNSQEEFLKKITGSHVSEELKKQMIQASEGISKNLHKDVESLRQFIGHLNTELKSFNKENRNYLAERLKFEKLRFRSLSIAAGICIILAGVTMFFPADVVSFFSNIFNAFR